VIRFALAGAVGYFGAGPVSDAIADRMEPTPGIAGGVKRVAIREQIKLPVGAAIAIASYLLARKVI
jgi:hypothetical protein